MTAHSCVFACVRTREKAKARERKTTGETLFCVFDLDAISALSPERFGKRSSQESQVCLAGWKLGILVFCPGGYSTVKAVV